MSDVLGFPMRLATMYWETHLEIAEVEAQLAYDYATSMCSNCPRNLHNHDYPVPDECCKDNPEYGESEEEYLTKCRALMGSIKAVLGDEAEKILAEARLNLR